MLSPSLSPNLPSKFKIYPGIRGGIVVYGVSYTTFNYKNKRINDFDVVNAIRIYNNIVDQPVGQALCLLAMGTTSIQSNLFNSEFSGVSSVGTVNTLKDQGAVFIGNVGKQQIRSNGLNISLPLFLTASSTSIPRGNVLFNNNQIRIGPEHISLISIYLLSDDDIGFIDNESDCQDLYQNLVVNSFILGTVVRAFNNRLKETNSISDGRLVFSLGTFSMVMNITADNQGDDCIIASNIIHSPSEVPVIERDNQVLHQNKYCQRYKQAFLNKPVNSLSVDMAEKEKNNKSTSADTATNSDINMTNNNKDVDLNRSNRLLEEIKDQSQYNRLNMINYFKDIQNTTNSLLKDELKKIAAIQNQDNKTKIIQLDKLVKQNLNLLKDFSTELEITKIKPPMMGSSQILIQGRITDKKLKGIPNLTVSLTNKKGKNIGVYSNATDSSGYYSIIMDEDKKEKILKEVTDSGGKNYILQLFQQKIRLSINHKVQ